MTQQQLLNNRTHIGQRVKEIRTERGISQVELAAAADIRRATVSNVENGSFSVGIDVLCKILDALQCRIDIERIK